MIDVETFLKRHEEKRFRHSDELIACIKSGKCALEITPDSPASVATSHLLRTYRRRAEHLKQFGSLHAQDVRDDVVALCDELEKTSEECVLLWMFSMPLHFDYSVFEGGRLHEILGCILGVDKRRINEKDWEALWKTA